MKHFSTLILSICLLFYFSGAALATPVFNFSPDDGIDRSMVVPYTKPTLSSLTKVLGDTAHMKVYGALTQQDEVYIYDDIQLLLTKPDVTKIKVYLNSAGGGAFAGFAIGDQFRRIKDNFTLSVHASGIVASAAVMVFAAFENRYAAPNTMFMVHEVAVGATEGMNRTDVKNMEEMFDQLTERYIGILVEVTGPTKADWETMLEEETYFFVNQAEAWGLVTEVK